ncbi:Putative amino acid permease [Mycobacteroides abscessus]|nr:Putative amino acid permease [Mycobacteroides abscessus]
MTVANSESETPDAGYSRGLSARTVQMIAIGGAIGTGLFYGAGGAIEKAGPGLILAYLVAGLAIFVIMRALGELLVYRPVSGSISEYAEEFMGRFAGFANGWTYWAVWATTCMAEITVAGVYIQRWWPGIPQWVTALVVLLILFGANLISVKIFGEAEFWFSMIKVTAILGMIIIGIGVLLPISGLGPETGPSVANLWNDGGVFPTGFSQALLSLQIVVFAYVGVELVGVTAGGAENPPSYAAQGDQYTALPHRVVLRGRADRHSVDPGLAELSQGREPLRCRIRIPQHSAGCEHRELHLADGRAIFL